MLKRFLPVLVLTVFLATGATAAATAREDNVSANMQLTVINNTDLIMAYEGRPIAKDKAATFTMPRFNREEPAEIILERRENKSDNDPSDYIILFLVRAPETLWQGIENGGDLKACFYERDNAVYADVCLADDDSVKAVYLYHPMLREWAILETAHGVMVYQENWLEWDEWQASQANDGNQEFRTNWEHLYPGEMDDWLRSPMESRGFIVPITEIYNVGTWSHNEVGSFKLERLTPDIPKVTKDQLMVVKTFGDFGWGMLSYQTADQKWHFIEYGYDGWGGFGGLWYKIIDDAPSDYITYDAADVPWTATGRS